MYKLIVSKNVSSIWKHSVSFNGGKYFSYLSYVNEVLSSKNSKGCVRKSEVISLVIVVKLKGLLFVDEQRADFFGEFKFFFLKIKSYYKN